ncbi:acetylornithine aminotransferase [Umbelopsis sp. WA50703]
MLPVRIVKTTVTTGYSKAIARSGGRIASAVVMTKRYASNQAEITHPDSAVPQKTLDTIERFNKYTLNTYARPDLMFTHGKGSYIYDTADRKYLDFTAGIAVNALGHSDEEVANVLFEQAKKLVHCSNLYHNENTGLLAEKLVTATVEQGGFNASKVFLSNSGTESNEGALKFGRKWGKVVDPSGKKHKIVSFTNAFHGRSMGALSATYNPKYQQPFAPLIPGFDVGEFNNVEQVKSIIDDDTCAVIVEPIQGEGGVHPAKKEFLEALRKECDDHNALLIFDEIQCGLGRTGKLWAHQHYSETCRPDILTMAKPLANGIPIGAILITERVADVIKIGDHGTTFGGNPLATAVALSVFNRLSNPQFLNQVEKTGQVLKQGLDRIQTAHPQLVKEVRGNGMLIGLEFAKDPTPVVKMARERGLLVITAGSNTVRIVPSLTLTEAEAQEGLSKLQAAVQQFSEEQ